MSSLLLLVLICSVSGIASQQQQADFYHGANIRTTTRLNNGSNLDLDAFSAPVLSCQLPAGTPTSVDLYMSHNNVRVTPIAGRVSLISAGALEKIIQFSNVTALDGGQYACLVNGVKTAVITLRVRPLVIVTPDDLIVSRTASSSLTCVVIGYPMPTRRWLDPITSLMTLTFHAGQANKPLYNCTASSPVGSASDSARAVIYDKLTAVRAYPASFDVLLSSNFLLPCEVTGGPNRRYSWFEVSSDGSTTALGSTQVLSNNSLLLSPLDTTSNKRYRCTVRSVLPWNAMTDAQDPLSIDFRTNIIAAPNGIKFSDQFTPFLQAGAFSLVCSAMGAPSPEVRLWRNGVPVQSSLITTTHFGVSPRNLVQLTLFVGHPSAEQNSGRYLCAANNSVGPTLNKSVEVALTVPLQFAGEPMNTSLLVGNTLSLACATTGYPPAQYQWYHNNTRLAGATQANLTVLGASINSSGTYNCTALSTSLYSSRTFGSPITSAAASVAVRLPAAILSFVATPSPAVQVGGSVNLTCTAAGHPPPTISFWFNDAMIRPSPVYALRRALAFSRTLSILSAGVAQQGLYWCNATNAVGTSARVIRVDVPRAPSFETPLSPKIVARLGGAFQLVCNVSGNPPPTVAWTAPSQSSGRRVGNAFVMSAVTQGDAGMYTCAARNPSGMVQDSTMLDVQEAPVIRTGLSDTAVELGGTARLVCVCRGEPLPSVAWHHKGNAVTPPSDQRYAVITSSISADEVRSELSISGITSADFGLVVCSFANVWDTRSSNGNLMQLLPPLPLVGRRVASNKTSGSATTSILLSWAAPAADVTRPAETYRVQYWRTGQSVRFTVTTNTSSVELIGLVASAAYTWQVQAENAAGTSAYSAESTFTTAATPAPEGQTKPFYNEIWFYGAAGGAGFALLVLLLVIICCRCRRKDDEDIFDPDAQNIRNATKAPTSDAVRMERMVVHEQTFSDTSSPSHPIPSKVYYDSAYSNGGTPSSSSKKSYGNTNHFRDDSSANVSISDTILQYHEQSVV